MMDELGQRFSYANTYEEAGQHPYRKLKIKTRH